MAQEMAEQPERLRALLACGEEISDQIRDCLPVPLHGTTIAARGSSDHAATYGRYLIEPPNRQPVSMAAPSLHTLYGVRTHRMLIGERHHDRPRGDGRQRVLVVSGEGENRTGAGHV